MTSRAFAPALAVYAVFCQVGVGPDGSSLRWPNGASLPVEVLYPPSKPAVP